MPGTRYKLIGECVVFIVKSPDAILKRVLTELKQVKKIKSKAKKSYYKYSSVKSKSKLGGKTRKRPLQNNYGLEDCLLFELNVVTLDGDKYNNIKKNDQRFRRRYTRCL